MGVALFPSNNHYDKFLLLFKAYFYSFQIMLVKITKVRSLITALHMSQVILYFVRFIISVAFYFYINFSLLNYIHISCLRFLRCNLAVNMHVVSIEYLLIFKVLTAIDCDEMALEDILQKCFSVFIDSIQYNRGNVS